MFADTAVKLPDQFLNGRSVDVELERNKYTPCKTSLVFLIQLQLQYLHVACDSNTLAFIVQLQKISTALPGASLCSRAGYVRLHPESNSRADLYHDLLQVLTFLHL